MAVVNVKKLAEQLDAAQSILDEIRVTCGFNALAPSLRTSSKRTQTALEAAKKAFEDRRLRSTFIGSNEIFGEPGWDILLNLFIKQIEQKDVTLENANLSTGISLSAQSRWLRLLEHSGLIVCKPDPQDATRQLLRLTSSGYHGMLSYFERDIL